MVYLPNYITEKEEQAIGVARNMVPLEAYIRQVMRGNSTNGMGDGHVEIFDYLAKSKASFEIMGNHKGGIAYKAIRVIFDNLGRRIIRTGYRYEILSEALAATDFEVVAWVI